MLEQLTFLPNVHFFTFLYFANFYLFGNSDFCAARRANTTQQRVSVSHKVREHFKQ